MWILQGKKIELEILILWRNVKYSDTEMPD